jgi:hypothetical protein
MTLRFKCKSCDQFHEETPTFGFDAPAIVQWIKPEDREKRVELGTDDCVVDQERFLVRGCIEIPVIDAKDLLIWGVWVDVSQPDFRKWIDAFDLEKRAHVGPFAGYLGNVLPCYPDTFNLHVVMHLRDKGMRPYIKVSASEHPLHVEQRNGVTQTRLAEIYEQLMHPQGAQ